MVINKSSFRKYFTLGNPRSIAAKKNIIALFVIKGISIIFSLIIVPMTINYVNPTRYGIWLTLSSIFIWFTFFDLGLGNGMRNRFAEAKANKDFALTRIYVSTTYAALTIIFIFLWLTVLIVNFFVDWTIILNAPSSMTRELSILAIIVFTSFCCQIVLKTVNTVLIADQKPSFAAMIDTCGQMLSLIIIFLLTKITKGSLINLAFALGFAPIIILSISTYVCFNKDYRQIAPSIKYVKIEYIKDILNLGLKFFVIQLTALLLFQTSNIIITQILDPEHVTIYNIIFKYFFTLTMIFTIILNPFWTAFTDAYSHNDYEWMRNVTNKIQKAWLILIPFTILMLITSKFAFKIWIGKSFHAPLLLSILMASYTLLYARFSIFVTFINGIGKVHLLLYTNIAACLLYIPLAIILTKLFSLNGLVISNILIALIHSVTNQIQIEKILAKKDQGIWSK